MFKRICAALGLFFAFAALAHAQAGVQGPGSGYSLPAAPLFVYNGVGWVPATSGAPVSVSCVAGCSASGAFTDNSAFTVGSSAISPIGAYYSTSTPAISSGNAGRVRMDASSYLYTDCVVGCSGGATTPGDAFANPSTAGLTFGLIGGFNGTTWDRLRDDSNKYLFVDIGASISLPVTGTFWQATQPVSGTFWQTTQPVSLASLPAFAATPTFNCGTGCYQATQPVSGTFWQATQPVSGTFWQATQPVSQSSMPWQDNSTPQSSSTFAALAYRGAAVTTAAAVKASAGNLYGWYVYNPNSSACSLDVFNTASPTLGTTTPILSLVIPATGAANIAPGSIAVANFSAAIEIAAVTAPGGASTCATGMTVNLWYE